MRPTLQSTLRFTLFLLALTLSVAGCGYKDSLYLRETKPAAKKPALKPVAAPAPAPVTAPAAPAEAQQTP